MAGRSLRIGELAAQVSLRPAALRYYEQIGRIPPPERIGAQRLPAVDCPPIALIRMAQQAGLPLAETRALFTGAPPGMRSPARRSPCGTRSLTRFGLAGGRWTVGRHRDWHTTGQRVWMPEDELLAHGVACGPLVRVFRWTPRLAAAGVAT